MGLPIDTQFIPHSSPCSSSTQGCIENHPHQTFSHAHKITTHKEAEDLLSLRKRPRITRQSSCHQLGRGGEIEDLSKRSGALWDCVKRKPNRLGGYIYKFKLKEQFDDITCTNHDEKAKRWKSSLEKQNHLFPALEKRGIRVLEWDPALSRDKGKWIQCLINDYLYNLYTTNLKNICSWNSAFENVDDLWNEVNSEEQLAKAANDAQKKAQVSPEVPFLWRLGYKSRLKDDGVYLYIPEKDALTANWEALREKYPHLSPLSIASGDGIAGDLAFVEANMSYDVLLSNGPEFLHDSLAHVVPMLILMLNTGIKGNPKYERRRFKIVRIIAKPYRTIMMIKRMLKEDFSQTSLQNFTLYISQMEKIESALGALADVLSNSDSYQSPIKKFKLQSTKFGALWRNLDWKEYWSQKFGAENINYSLLRLTWSEMLKTERSFDQFVNKGRKYDALK